MKIKKLEWILRNKKQWITKSINLENNLEDIRFSVGKDNEGFIYATSPQFKFYKYPCKTINEAKEECQKEFEKICNTIIKNIIQ